MDQDSRRGKLFARLLAFCALAGAIVIVALVISSSLDGGGEEEGEKAKAPDVAGCKPDTEYEDVEDGYYVIQPEDQLELIEERTCVSVEELQRLNPETDPQALVPGTCLKLELGGCQNREF